MMQAQNRCFLLSEIKRTSRATILSSSHQALGGKEDSETPQTLQEVGGKVHDGNQRQKVEEKIYLYLGSNVGPAFHERSMKADFDANSVQWTQINVLLKFWNINVEKSTPYICDK